jgi:hypothetical protein
MLIEVIAGINTSRRAASEEEGEPLSSRTAASRFSRAPLGSIICGPVAQLARSKPQQQETSASDLALQQGERIIEIVDQERIQFNGEHPEQYRKTEAGRLRAASAISASC